MCSILIVNKRIYTAAAGRCNTINFLHIEGYVIYNIIFAFCRDNSDIRIQIIFPMTFVDTDKAGNSYTFLAQKHHCLSSYTQDSLEEPEQVESHCKVADEFSHLNFKPSPNGDFTLKLFSHSGFDLDAVVKLKIGLAGTFILKS